MNKIIVIGGGGHAKVVVSALKKRGGLEILGYADPEDRGPLLGVPRLGDDAVLPAFIRDHPGCSAAIGIGTTGAASVREAVALRLKRLGFKLPPVISPHAVVNEGVSVGDAAVVFDGAVINSGASLGFGVIVNTNATIEHDCRIGDFVHIAPGATLSGGVTVGAHSMIGVGACVIQGITIGERCLIGAGSVVVRDHLEPGIYAGSPARRFKRNGA